MIDASAEEAGTGVAVQVIVPIDRLVDHAGLRKLITSIPSDGVSSYSLGLRWSLRSACSMIPRSSPCSPGDQRAVGTRNRRRASVRQLHGRCAARRRSRLGHASPGMGGQGRARRGTELRDAVLPDVRSRGAALRALPRSRGARAGPRRRRLRRALLRVHTLRWNVSIRAASVRAASRIADRCDEQLQSAAKFQRRLRRCEHVALPPFASQRSPSLLGTPCRSRSSSRTSARSALKRSSDVAASWPPCNRAEIRVTSRCL